MDSKRKNQLLYQKTEFNNHLICQMPSVIKCCKCKKNISIENNTFQICVFCGTPNQTKKY